MLFLILIPIAGWQLASRVLPARRWLVLGATFGAVVYPFFNATTLPLMYMGRLGFFILEYTNPVTLFHRAPGKILYFAVEGHASPNSDLNLSLIALNAVVWGIVYGVMGWYIDRNPASNRKNLPFLLLAIPALYGLATFSFTMTKAVVWNATNSYGAVCYQVMDAEPGAKVWLDIGSPPKLQLSRFGGMPLSSTQWCGNYNTHMDPLEIQAYSPTDENVRKQRATSEDNPSPPLTIPIVADGKSCVGIFPDNSISPPGWIARITDCALTSHSRGTR